jgi:hypothetical protein
MPLTAAKIYPKQFHNTLAKGLRDIVAFLINDHGSITGPAWSIVEAFDGTASSLQIPSTTSGSGALASFTGTFSWKDDALIPNDWIVLETNIAGGLPEFQLYIEYATTTAIQYILFPFEDFATGGGAVSPPTFPDRAVGSITSVVTHSLGGITDGGWYTVIADEQMMALVITRGGKTACTFGYIGSVDEAATTDTRPFVIHDSPANVSVLDSGASVWNRVSPIDNDTEIGLGYWTYIRASSVSGMTGGKMASDTTFWLDEQPVLPTMVTFNNTGHQHVAGYLRNVFEGHARLAYRSTLGTGEYIAISDDTNDGAIVLPWDGSTEW